MTQAEPGGVARRERRDAAENRERILAAARRLFAQQGVAATSMNAIAQSAGVGPGTLYRRFGHKGLLCQAMLADDLAAFHAQVQSLTEGEARPATPLERLLGVFDALLAMVEGHMPLLAASQDGSLQTPRSSVFETPFYRWLGGIIEALLAEAVAQGQVGSLDVPWTTDVLLATMLPEVVEFQRRERGFSRERMLAGIERVLAGEMRT